METLLLKKEKEKEAGTRRPPAPQPRPSTSGSPASPGACSLAAELSASDSGLTLEAGTGKTPTGHGEQCRGGREVHRHAG